MYEACFNNNFTDALVFYLCILLLFLLSPCLFIWELINTLRSSFQCTENMSQKVVLITGASSGLGELMAYEYAKRNACLAIIATKKPESRLEQVADRARELGSPDVLVVFADVSKVEECRMFVDDTIRHFGRCGGSSGNECRNCTPLFGKHGCHQIRTCDGKYDLEKQ
ncbi:hypothetical protein L6452_17060 [Arctium lappa]|uniref:Uncharacterized protein n=1 Tax=Arctium lappa TaxID=4217 RepID=A0ACB9C2F0_ARCLA|nr:hypothetical protein L6452_17060 [Arctium lappa]